MEIPQPKRGEVRLWMLGVMASAVVSMAGALAWQDRVHRERIERKDDEILNCQNERTRAEADFRKELKSLYTEVQAFREEIYQQSMNQQRKLKKLNR